MFALVISQTARAEVDVLRAFDRPRVLATIEGLRFEPDVETRNRKPLREPLVLLPEATWEARVGAFRVFYRIEGETVRVLRVILKRGSTAESL